jgi:hypothetical protein
VKSKKIINIRERSINDFINLITFLRERINTIKEIVDISIVEIIGSVI